MEWKRGALCALVLGTAVEAQAGWIGPFISELHYDNEGADVGEFVAVSAPHGMSLDGWSLVFYNGSNGKPYGTQSLDGRVDTGHSGWGERHWHVAGLQNGPDGIALVDPDEVLIDLVAYGRVFDLVAGPAKGGEANLLPLVEDGRTPVGWSLQRFGDGAQWNWFAGPASPGLLNPGLVVAPAGRVPTANVAALLLAAGLGWMLARRAPGAPAVSA
jgi:hypothetical protein